MSQSFDSKEQITTGPYISQLSREKNFISVTHAITQLANTPVQTGPKIITTKGIKYTVCSDGERTLQRSQRHVAGTPLERGDRPI